MTFRFNARGHPSILATHKTTLEITRTESLTKRGDCIVAVGSTKGLPEFPKELRETLAHSGARGQLVLRAGNLTFKVGGWGDPKLTFSHPTDIVLRKSDFISDRTLFVNADKSASDLPREIVEILQDPKSSIMIEVSASLL